MNNTPIRNLKDLEKRKLELRNSINTGIDNPMKTVTSLINTVKNKQERQKRLGLFSDDPEGDDEMMKEGVKALLTLTASLAVSRFKLGTLPKMILTTGVAIATPIIVDKIHKKLNEKKQ